MSFPQKAESLRAKAHLSGVRLPLLIGLTAVVLVVLGVAGINLMGILSSDAFSIQKGPDTQSSAGETDISQEVPKTLMVHIGGAVVSPAVYELAEGARVQDAVNAAGGFTEDAARDALNLARVLTDGEQVVVPLREQAENPPSSSVPESSGAPASPSKKVNINTASAEELDALPGVGPSTAQKIVADRKQNGPFATTEDLKRVSGIGDKKFDSLADFICVG